MLRQLSDRSIKETRARARVIVRDRHVSSNPPRNSRSVVISLNSLINAWCISGMAMSASSSKIAMMSLSE